MKALQDFVKKVARMRKAQKDAKKFNMRSQIDAAEKLEREVDKMLEEFGFQNAKAQQLRLDAQDQHKTDEVQGTYDANTQT